MSLKESHVCDLCLMDGEGKRLAKHRYRDDEGNEWNVCKKHLKLVKQAGLDYWELDPRYI